MLTSESAFRNGGGDYHGERGEFGGGDNGIREEK